MGFLVSLVMEFKERDKLGEFKRKAAVAAAGRRIMEPSLHDGYPAAGSDRAGRGALRRPKAQLRSLTYT